MSENGEVQESQAEKSEEISENVAQDDGQQEDVNDRLLRESQEWKKKFLDLKSQQEAAERNKLKEKGEMSEYAKRLESDLALKDNENKVLTEKMVFNNIKLQVAAKCPDAHDVDLVMAKLNLSKEDIDVERMTAHNLDEKLARVRKMDQFLFKKGVAGTEKRVPQYKGDSAPPKDPSKMSLEEHKKWVLENFK